MYIGNFEHWGVVVKPGEKVKCDPGGIYCHISQIALLAGKQNEDVRIFVKVDGKEILIGTLSVDKHPQYPIDLVFEKEFELLHTSKTSNVSAIGYKFSDKRKSDSSTKEDDESDEEVPLAIPLYSNTDDDKSKETESGVEKLAAPRPAATQSSEPRLALEETKNPGELKADFSGTDNDDNDEDYIDSEEVESGDDEDSIDEGDSETSDEDDDEDSPKNTKGNKNRPEETPLKTPPEKKARITTPSMGSGTDKRSGHVHVATPYPPSKLMKKTPSINDSSKQSSGYACKSCSKTFHSSVGLETHCKVKHARK